MHKTEVLDVPNTPSVWLIQQKAWKMFVLVINNFIKIIYFSLIKLPKFMK